MFLKPSTKLDLSKLYDNFKQIEKDYYWLKEKNYFEKTPHTFDDEENFYNFWLTAPFIYDRKIIDDIPNDFKKLNTVQIISELNVKPILATFSILQPNSEIKEHEDHDSKFLSESTNDFVIKYHIGIESYEPHLSGLVVAGETRFIEKNNLNIFNESLPHYAYNYSKYDRGTLILSFLYSELYNT